MDIQQPLALKKVKFKLVPPQILNIEGLKQNIVIITLRCNGCSQVNARDVHQVNPCFFCNASSITCSEYQLMFCNLSLLFFLSNFLHFLLWAFSFWLVSSYYYIWWFFFVISKKLFSHCSITQLQFYILISFSFPCVSD